MAQKGSGPHADAVATGRHAAGSAVSARPWRQRRWRRACAAA